MTHQVNPHLLQHQVNISVAGVGGTGSQILTGLARLHTALIALGHPGGLHVRAYDPDTVSSANVGRQLFSAADVGHPKAAILISRINACFGLNWQSRMTCYGSEQTPNQDLLISCVDSVKSRQMIFDVLQQGYAPHHRYWLDCGNTADSGQVILGQVSCQKTEEPLLPHFFNVFPKLLKKNVREINAPSCSLAEALHHQELFINQAVATYALQLLWQMFRHAQLDHHGYFINLKSGQTRPLMIAAKS